MRFIGGSGDFPSGLLRLFCQTGMDGRRGEQADAGVVMVRVIPGEEALAEAPAVLDATKAVGEVGAVLERLELRLGKRVIIARIRPAVGLCHPKI